MDDEPEPLKSFPFPFYSTDERHADARGAAFGTRLISHLDYFRNERDALAFASKHGGVVAAVPNGGPTFWRVRRTLS